MTTFKELGISNTLINALDKINIKTPSITQIKCINEAKLGYSIILQSRSGTGKTISFCIYLLDTLIHVPYEVIIIVPTRELAVQINILLNSIDPELSISLNIGGNDINNMECQDSPVIIATPGRFQTLIKQNTKKFKSNPGFCFWSNTRLLIFDEVDMLLDDHFYGQLKLICNKIVNPSIQIIATSATFIKPQFQKFEDLVEEIDKSYKSDSEVYKFHNKMDNLGLKSSFNEDSALCKVERIFKRIILTSSYINRMTSESQLNTLSIGNVYNDTNKVQSYQFIESDLPVTDSLCSRDEPSVLDGNLEFYMVQILDAPNIIMQIGLKIRCILEILHSINYKKCIIFCNQSHSRLQLYRFLQYFGFPCILNSARSSNKDRINISQLPDINNLIIICTDVMCRGIDVSNVDVVIKMDLPSTKENFLHRSGRTGRFGKSGKCITICSTSEVDTFRYFLYVLNFKLSPIEKLCKDLNIDENGIWNYIGKDEIILEPKLSIMTHFIYPSSGIKNNINVNYQDSHDNFKENNTSELVTFYSNSNLTVIESLLEGNTYDLKYNHINYWKQLIIS